MNKTYFNIDWNKNNKIALRNFSESQDHHDIVKTLLMRMLRRKNKNSNQVLLYSENDPNNKNNNYPDIWMRTRKGDIIVWEIQKEITTKWEKEVIERYKDVDLIIVPLKNLSKNIDKLKIQLKEFVI